MAARVPLVLRYLLVAMISIHSVTGSIPPRNVQRQAQMLSNILDDSLNTETGRLHRAPENIDVVDTEEVMTNKASENKSEDKFPSGFEAENLIKERINRDKLNRLMAALAAVMNNRRTHQMSPRKYELTKPDQQNEQAEDMDTMKRSLDDADHTVSDVLPPWTEFCRMLGRRDCGRFIRRR